MEIKEYQEIIKKTAVYPKNKALEYCTMGLCGESGEVAEKMKKLFRDQNGKVTDQFKKDVKKELGDVIWYVTALSNELGFSLEEVLDANYEKLIKRRQTNTLHGNGDDREELNETTLTKKNRDVDMYLNLFSYFLEQSKNKKTKNIEERC
jgi:NTP pyrophosphatase (non-canonical NTP hydrolase)